MSKKNNERLINIDGSKLKELLESRTGKTIKELSLDNGYSDSFLRMSIKSGKASPSVVTLARLYGIEPEAYELKPATSEDSKQITFEDLLTEDAKEALREVIKEAIKEAFTKLECKTMRVQYDELHRRYIATMFINKEIIEGA